MSAARLTREQSRSQTRLRLLDAAEELFAERGFGGTSLEQVAERAGFTRGAVYWNFEDKTELFAAVVERRSAARVEIVQALAGAQRRDQSLLDALRSNDADAPEDATRWHLLAIEELAQALRIPEERKRVAQRERRINEAMGDVAASVYKQRGGEPPFSREQLGAVIHALDWGLRMQHLLNPKRIPTALFYDVLSLLLRSTSEGQDPDPVSTP